jgi:hypothetical protein
LFSQNAFLKYFYNIAASAQGSLAKLTSDEKMQLPDEKVQSSDDKSEITRLKRSYLMKKRS